MTRTIYVVDDDSVIRASLHMLLRRNANTVIRGFSSGSEFIAELEDLDPGVVLLDMHMPGASGLDVLKSIQEAGPGRFTVIVLTGQGNIALAIEAMKAGAVDFLEKPYEPQTLLQCLTEAEEVHLVRSQAADRRQLACERLDRLSPRETEVLDGLIAGQANKVIAYNLDISPRTVEIYRANVMEKLNAASLAQALRVVAAAGRLNHE